MTGKCLVLGVNAGSGGTGAPAEHGRRSCTSTAFESETTRREPDSSLRIRRDHDERKQCANCGRGTRIVFTFVTPNWETTFRKCRRCLTKKERALIQQFVRFAPGDDRNMDEDQVLLPVECGGLTD